MRIIKNTIKQYKDNYREDNKEKIQEQRKAMKCCPTCGGQYQHVSKAQHLRSKKHTDTIQPI